jgi:adenylate cyclase
MTTLKDLIRGYQPAKVYLPRWLDRLGSQGIVSTNPQIIRRQRLTNIFAYASCFNAGGNMIASSLQEFQGFLVPHAVLAVLIVLAILIPRMHSFGDYLGAHMISGICIFGTVFLVWVYGRDSQIVQYYSLSAVLLLVFGIENWRRYTGWFVLAGICLFAALFLAPKEGLFVPQNHALREVLAVQTLLNTLVVMSLVIFFALATLRRAEVELENQHARASALVDTVFPPPIVARLISGREDRIADRIDGLTVLFADLVGFTRAARDLPPEEIIDYLDGLVRCFDQLCAKHGVDKIKTIGDCYMAVGGLSGDHRRQATAIGELALDMLRAVSGLPALGGHKLALRIGIHTGSATAGIIGDTRFSYDVWGDAVNMASRMESHGLPNSIQVSEAFRDAVAGTLRFSERGVVDIRSLGMTRTYLLEAGRSAA